MPHKLLSQKPIKFYMYLFENRHKQAGKYFENRNFFILHFVQNFNKNLGTTKNICMYIQSRPSDKLCRVVNGIDKRHKSNKLT